MLFTAGSTNKYCTAKFSFLVRFAQHFDSFKIFAVCLPKRQFLLRTQINSHLKNRINQAIVDINIVNLKKCGKHKMRSDFILKVHGWHN